MNDPVKQHAWLKQWIGEWTYESECVMEPGGPAMKFAGTETVRGIGDLWIMGESKGTMPDGSPATMILTIGYDPKRGRFVGTWIGSMVSYLWVYDGSLDAAEKVLTLETEGYMPTSPDTLSKFKDITEFRTNDHRVFTAHMLGQDGKWTQLMTTHYRRTR